MKPVVAKIPVPTMLEMTRAVALKNPIWRSNPGRGSGVRDDGIRRAWIHSMMRRASGAGILGLGAPSEPPSADEGHRPAGFFVNHLPGHTIGQGVGSRDRAS